MRNKTLFGKKKLYKIVWRHIGNYTEIIAARNEFQALRLFYQRHEHEHTSIISFEEYKLDTGDKHENL